MSMCSVRLGRLSHRDACTCQQANGVLYVKVRMRTRRRRVPSRARPRCERGRCCRGSRRGKLAGLAARPDVLAHSERGALIFEGDSEAAPFLCLLFFSFNSVPSGFRDRARRVEPAHQSIRPSINQSMGQSVGSSQSIRRVTQEMSKVLTFNGGKFPVPTHPTPSNAVKRKSTATFAQEVKRTGWLA